MSATDVTMMVPAGDILLKPEDAAKRLGVSVWSLARYRKAGLIKPAMRTLQGHHRYSITELDRFRRERLSKP